MLHLPFRLIAALTSGEKDGVQYHFVSKEEMLKAIEGGEFLEHANVHGNLYGTSRKAVTTVSGQCKVCILDIDIQVRRRGALATAAE